MISPFSLDILKKETIPSKHLGTKILELIVSLRAKNSQEELHTIYQKNLSLLKTSIKLPKETPSLEQINSYQVLIFGTRYFFLISQFLLIFFEFKSN